MSSMGYNDNEIAGILRAIVLSHTNALAIGAQDATREYNIGFITAILAVATGFGLPYEKMVNVVKNSKWELTWKNHI